MYGSISGTVFPQYRRADDSPYQKPGINQEGHGIPWPKGIISRKSARNALRNQPPRQACRGGQATMSVLRRTLCDATYSNDGSLNSEQSLRRARVVLNYPLEPDGRLFIFLSGENSGHRKAVSMMHPPTISPPRTPSRVPSAPPSSEPIGNPPRPMNSAVA